MALATRDSLVKDAVAHQQALPGHRENISRPNVPAIIPGAVNAPPTPENGVINWSQWYGAPNGPVYQNPNPLLAEHSLHLPSGYIGSNVYLTKFVGAPVFREDEWPTRLLLPWTWYNGNQITMTKWKGLRHVLDNLPEETLPTYVMFRKSQKMAQVRRFAKAYRATHGFMNSPEGQKFHYMSLGQIAYAVKVTVYQRACAKLISVPNIADELIGGARMHNRAGAMSIQLRDSLAFQAKLFGAVNKFGGMGFDFAVGEAIQIFERLDQVPDFIVIPSGVERYIRATDPTQQIAFLDNKLATTFQVPNDDKSRAISVPMYNSKFMLFTYRSHTSDQFEDTIDHFSRVRQIGNHYLMQIQVPALADPKDFNSSMRDIVILDYDTRTRSRIKFIDAIKNCGLWDNTGKLKKDVVNKLNNVGKDADSFTYEFWLEALYGDNKNWDQGVVKYLDKMYEKVQQTSATGTTTGWRGQPFTREQLIQDVQAGRDVPLQFMIVRPYMEFVASDASIGRREGLGNTYVRAPDFQLADDARYKVHVGTFDFWFEPVVWEHEQIRRIPSLFVKQYVTGGGTKFVSPDKFKNFYEPSKENGCMVAIAQGPFDTMQQYPACLYGGHFPNDDVYENLNIDSAFSNGLAKFYYDLMVGGNGSLLDQRRRETERLNHVSIQGLYFTYTAEGNRRGQFNTPHVCADNYFGEDESEYLFSSMGGMLSGNKPMNYNDHRINVNMVGARP